MALGLLCTGHHCSKPSKAQKIWTSLGRSGNSCSRLLSIDISRLATSESGTAIRYGWQQHYTIYLDKNTDFFVPQKDQAHWQISFRKRPCVKYKDNAVGNVVAETGRDLVLIGTTARLSDLSMPLTGRDISRHQLHSTCAQTAKAWAKPEPR